MLIRLRKKALKTHQMNPIMNIKAQVKRENTIPILWMIRIFQIHTIPVMIQILSITQMFTKTNTKGRTPLKCLIQDLKEIYTTTNLLMLWVQQGEISTHKKNLQTISRRWRMSVLRIMLLLWILRQWRHISHLLLFKNHKAMKRLLI